MPAKKTKLQELINQLTNREKQVLTLLTRGYSTFQISQKLKLSINTIRIYRSNINRKAKLNKHNLISLVRLHLKLEAEKQKIISQELFGSTKRTTDKEQPEENTPSSVFKEGLTYEQHLDAFRYSLLLEGLKACNHNVPLLSRRLEIPERTLYRLVKKFGLK